MTQFLRSYCPASARRRRGISAACNKFTATLQIDLGLREFITRCDPASFQRALASSQGGAKSRREVFEKIPEDARILNGILHHESDHLRRQFGTSAGLMQWAGATCLVGLFRFLMGHAAEARPACPLPLVRWALGRSGAATIRSADGRMVIDRIASGSPLHSQALQVLCLSALMSELEGDDAPSHGTATAECGLTILHRWAGGEDAVALSDVDTAARIHGNVIGAKHFFEAFAIQEEANRVAALGCSDPTYQKLILESEDYGWLLATWHRRFPGLECTRSGSTRPGDLITETWRILPVEAYAAADLALWPPFGPRGLVSATRPVQWQDVQPGWRFLQCLDALERLGRFSTSVGSERREEAFVETQRLLCEHLNWPAPVDLAGLWLEYFDSGQWIDTGFLLGHPDEASVLIARRVLRERLANPFDTVFNNAAWTQHDELQFPIWITMEAAADGVRRHVYHARHGTGGNAVLHSYYVHAVTRSILFGDRALELLAPTHQREALDAVDRVMGGGGWDSAYLRETLRAALDIS